MSTSQHSPLSIVAGIGRREELERSDQRSDQGYEPTIGLKTVAKILDCSAEQCRRLAEAKKIPVFRIGYGEVIQLTSMLWTIMRHASEPRQLAECRRSNLRGHL